MILGEVLNKWTGFLIPERYETCFRHSRILALTMPPEWVVTIAGVRSDFYTMRIRQAVSADLDAVKSCANEAYAKYVQRIGKKPAPMIADFAVLIAKETVHVMVDDGSVLGFIVLYPCDDHIHVANVAVFPEQIGRGIGGQLLAFAEHEARRLELPAVELYTHEKMTENLSLYPHLGYQEISRRKQAGFSRVYFRKNL